MSAVAGPSSSPPSDVAKLRAEVVSKKSKLEAEIENADDPLTLYDDLVKWIVKSYPPQYLAHSGIIEILEEAARKYKDDTSYKSDFRYLQLWMTFASLADRPSAVFKFILRQEIGTIYAALYEEYALVLEREGRYVTKQLSCAIPDITQILGSRGSI